MGRFSLRLPESLHRALGDLAHQDGVSMNQFIATAVAEKIATLKAIDFLKERAVRGNRRGFDAVLAKVLDAPPAPGDEISQKARRCELPAGKFR